MAQFGVALVGWGVIARTHAEALSACEDAGLRVVCRRAGTRPADLPTEVDVDSDLAAVLRRDDIDVVGICTPTGSHADLALRALDAGKHVVVEKPIARFFADGEAVVAAARRRSRLLSVISQRRFEPAVRHVKQIVESGMLGRPVLGEALLRWRRGPEYYAQAPWRGTVAQDGGALMNQGIHLVDLLRWMMGPVAEVRGLTATVVHDIEAEDAAAAALRFTSGALGLVAATTASSPGLPGELNLFFERGCVGLTESGITRWEVPGVPQPDSGPPASSGAADPAAIGAAGHRQQWRDVLDALAAGRPPEIDGPAGLAALALVEAVYEAQRTGGAVRPGA